MSLVFLSLFFSLSFPSIPHFFSFPPLLRSRFLSPSSPLPFLCGVAVGSLAGRRGSPEGILGAEVPVIHYPACFSLWQPCDRVLLRALTHTHTHAFDQCLDYTLKALDTHITLCRRQPRAFRACNDIQYSTAVFLIMHVNMYLYVSVCMFLCANPDLKMQSEVEWKWGRRLIITVFALVACLIKWDWTT